MVKPPGQTERDAKARILDAADAVFVRRGTDGARMQEIADEAGVNKALLHYYFRSKADLARAVWLRIASSFVPGIFEMLASDASLDDKIDRFVDAYLTRLSRHHYLITYVVSEAARHPDLVPAFYSSGRGGAARHMMSKLRRQIGEEIEKGRMAPVAPDQFLITLVSSCAFPFAARPMITAGLGLGAKGFDKFIEKRRKDLPVFLKRALRP
ncbi:MAG TPA: TetR/AcrR family transcriptional regulator [Vicinamibacteria bacterium]|nr:TetR/AcrR family transcriptional regulator [Vicinamibacteria bacterium]